MACGRFFISVTFCMTGALCILASSYIKASYFIDESDENSVDFSILNSQDFHQCSVDDSCSQVAAILASNADQQNGKEVEQTQERKKRRIFKKSNRKAVYSSCSELYKDGWRTDGIYDITLSDGNGYKANCDMTTQGGGWTIIQRRVDQNTEFNRNWDDYARGFGNQERSFWMGLRQIHLMTWGKNLSILMEATLVTDVFEWAILKDFAVGSEASNFPLQLKRIVPATNKFEVLTLNSGTRFSTYDRDNDCDPNNCAAKYEGGWWHVGGVLINDVSEWAILKDFAVGSEATKFQLHIKVKKPAQNHFEIFSQSNGAYFSTYDRDNDIDVINCAETYDGGWWHIGGSQLACSYVRFNSNTKSQLTNIRPAVKFSRMLIK